MNLFEIQNSLKGKIWLSTHSYGKILWYFVKAANPIKPNEIKKGMKIYDYKNSYVFATDLHEATILSEAIANYLTTGQFPVFKEHAIQSTNNYITIAHFPTNKITQLTLTQGQNGGAMISYRCLENKQLIFELTLFVSKFKLILLRNILNQAPILTAISELVDKNNQQTTSNTTAKQKKSQNNTSISAPQENQITLNQVDQVFQNL